MRVYFLSEIPSALFIGGAYLGLIDGFERSAELDPAAGVFCEAAPCGDYAPVRFCFNEDFLFAPPEHVRLYFTKNAVAVYLCGYLRADQSLRVLWQERLGETLLTLCLQGKLQLNVNRGADLRIVSLPDALEKCAVRPFAGGFLLESEEAFALIREDGTVSVLSEGKVLSAEETLKAEVPFHDAAGHTAVCEWTDGALTACTIRSAAPPDGRTFSLALFESAMIGADCTPFLAPALAEKAGALKEFLGKYVSVVLTEEKDTVGLVYERKERVYDVRLFRTDFEDGKISNIKPI